MSQNLNITESANAILTAKDSFGEQFYERLFADYPELANYFEGVNMSAQASMLTVALTLIEKYYSKPGDAIHQYLRVLGSRHKIRQIPRESIPDFLRTILVTLGGFHGDAWSEALERQWQDAVNTASPAIYEGYDQHFHV